MFLGISLYWVWLHLTFKSLRCRLRHVLPLFLLCFAWKMMQCHVDACDDMQPPELVSVPGLFFQEFSLNLLSDNKFFLSLNMVSGSFHLLKIVNLLTQNFLATCPNSVSYTCSVNRNMKVCSITVRRQEFFLFHCIFYNLL